VARQSALDSAQRHLLLHTRRSSAEAVKCPYSTEVDSRSCLVYIDWSGLKQVSLLGRAFTAGSGNGTAVVRRQSLILETLV